MAKSSYFNCLRCKWHGLLCRWLTLGIRAPRSTIPHARVTLHKVRIIGFVWENLLYGSQNLFVSLLFSQTASDKTCRIAKENPR